MNSLTYISLVRQADYDKYFLLKVGKESTMAETEILQLIMVFAIAGLWFNLQEERS